MDQIPAQPSADQHGPLSHGIQPGQGQPGQGGRGPQLAARLAGAVLLAVTGAIHLDLYLTGYRNIPTIGPLFLLQVISAFALAAAVVAVRGRLAPAVAGAGAGFAIATLGGYLLTLWVGLFGFREVRTTAGLTAGIVEVAAFAALSYAAVSGWRALPARVRSLPGGPAGLTAVLSVTALAVLAVSAATASGGASGSTTAAAPAAGVVRIVIKNFMFSPANPDVRPGQRIEVTNEDQVAHTLTAGPSSKDRNAFSTGSVGPGQTKIISAPRRAGMYPFTCLIHPFMTGILIVGR